MTVCLYGSSMCTSRGNTRRGFLVFLLLTHTLVHGLDQPTTRTGAGSSIPMVPAAVSGIGAAWSSYSEPGSSSTRHRRRAFPGPEFHPLSPTNITSQLHAHAYLPCRIKNLGNRSVSWIRNRDQHILTVDRYTFIADERFTAFHDPSTQTWTLQIRYAQERDQGSYECQISTEPKMSNFFQLTITAPVVSISGEGEDMFVKSGSTVDIRCVISNAVEEPQYIFWYHDGARVVGTPVFSGMFDSGKRKVVTAERVSPTTLVSVLSISDVTHQDSGNYTCAPASLERAHVLLHVLNGERPAAMQDTASTSTSSGSGPVSSTALCSIQQLLLLLLMILLLNASPIWSRIITT